MYWVGGDYYSRYESIKRRKFFGCKGPKLHYVKYGGLNTLHLRPNMRRAQNHIAHVVDDQGVRYMDIEDIEGIIVNYFTKLFLASSSLSMLDVLYCIKRYVYDDMNNALYKPYYKLEVKLAVKQMHPHKALGLDGMNPCFFSKF